MGMSKPCACTWANGKVSELCASHYEYLMNQLKDHCSCFVSEKKLVSVCGLHLDWRGGAYSEGLTRLEAMRKAISQIYGIADGVIRNG